MNFKYSNEFEMIQDFNSFPIILNWINQFIWLINSLNTFIKHNYKSISLNQFWILIHFQSSRIELINLIWNRKWERKQLKKSAKRSIWTATGCPSWRNCSAPSNSVTSSAPFSRYSLDGRHWRHRHGRHWRHRRRRHTPSVAALCATWRWLSRRPPTTFN